MNPLPRFLGMALFIVLAALVGLVAVPLWQSSRAPADKPAAALPGPPGPAARDATTPNPAARISSARLWQKSVFATAVVGLVLAAALVVALTLPHRPETRPPFASVRQEVGTLAKLAESSAVQTAELHRERDVRRRAEEDAQLKQQLLAQSVDEKIRLGQDLHDGIIQSLYAVGLTLETVRPLVTSDPAQAERRLEEVRASLNGAIRDVRAYITGLAPENLRRASFGRGVAALFEQIRAGRDARIDVNVDEDATGLLTEEQNIEALQIAREAISNALRHGGASQITVRMHKGDGEICLLVQDDGKGFDPATGREGGHGMSNMRARAERIGASLRVASEPGHGTRIVANFPIPHAV
jgi:signal transduction histidine kinase